MDNFFVSLGMICPKCSSKLAYELNNKHVCAQCPECIRMVPDPPADAKEPTALHGKFPLTDGGGI